MQYLVSILTIIVSVFYFYKVAITIKGPAKWIYFEVIYNCFIKFIIAYLNLPSFLNYFTDIFLICLIVSDLGRKNNYIGISNDKRKYLANSLSVGIIIFLIATIFSYVSNLYSPLLYFWGFRNNIRFLLFAVLCVRNLKRSDIQTIFSILNGFFVLNILAVTYEFFFSGVQVRTGDTISGLYSMGIDQGGGNGPLNWLICIMCIYAFVKYLQQEKRLQYLLGIIIGSIYMAALSELKIFFIEFIVILILSIAFSKKSLKIGIVGISGVIAVYAGINLIYIYFPQFINFYSMDSILTYMGLDAGYQGYGTINRIHSLPYVWNRFLVSWKDKLFGIGFGNADYSSYSFLTSSFYINNSRTLYQFFYAPFVLVETGILGFATFVMIFVRYLIRSVKVKPMIEGDETYRIIAIIIAVLSIAMLFYNQSLKIETSGYMVHLLLCIPFILQGSSAEDYESLVKLNLRIRIRI